MRLPTKISSAPGKADTGRRSSSFFRDKEGVAAVEAALLLPILILFLFGIIELTRVAYTKAVLTFAVGEATRFAITRTGSNTTRIKTEVEDHLYLLEPGNIQTLEVLESDNGDLTKTVNMTLTYKFTSLMPMVHVGNFDLTASASFIRE